MRIIHFSDTHGYHEHVDFADLKADVAVCSGDITNRGELMLVEEFLDWYQSKTQFKYKIFIAGNHDFCFEDVPERIKQILENYPDIIYLNDSGVYIEGVLFWGSPIQPLFHNWAFNRQRGEEIKQHWDLIPRNTNVLIVHGPPFGTLDWCLSGLRVGCEDLLEAINEIKPQAFLCGHIHESYGITGNKETIFSNASLMNKHYYPCNQPIVIEIPSKS